MILIFVHTQREMDMRTNIIIDDELMTEAQALGGLKTKKETVEEALKQYIHIKKQADIRQFRGKLHWEGNLAKMRTGL
jgi:Arc/MetJ family transcription regulator